MRNHWDVARPGGVWLLLRADESLRPTGHSRPRCGAAPLPELDLNKTTFARHRAARIGFRTSGGFGLFTS